MLARRWYQCRNQIQKLTCAQPQFNRSLLLLLLLRPVPLQRRTRQPVAHLRPPPAHTSRSPANIGRAQYRNSRSRPALSCAATRTPACTEKPTLCPHPCITATVSLLSNPRRSISPSTRCLTRACTRSAQASSACAPRKASPWRPCATTPSSMHKCKCTCAFSLRC